MFRDIHCKREYLGYYDIGPTKKDYVIAFYERQYVDLKIEGITDSGGHNL